MSRSAPWYWSARSAWYGTIGGKRYCLAKGAESDLAIRAAAHARFAEIVGKLERSGSIPLSPGSVYSVATLGKLYLKASEDKAYNTFKSYKMVVGQFSAAYGSHAAEDIRVHHVEDWVKAQKWSPGTIHSHLTVIKTWWRWAFEREYIPANTLKHLKRPAPSVRERIPTEAEADALLAIPKPECLQQALQIMSLTGCRPCEVYNLEAKHVDFENGLWSLAGKTTSRTGQLRHVWMPPKAQEIIRELVKTYPTGPLFRSPSGRKWTGTAMSKEIAKLRRIHEIPEHVSPVTLRHCFATRALERKIAPATVATLLGHKSTSQVERTYGRL